MAQEAMKGFVLFWDYRQHVALLNDEERGKLLMALLDYGEEGKEPELDGAALMAFSFIRAQMDRDAERYAETCRKRREAGQKGGRPQKAKEENGNQEEAKKAKGFSENQTEAKKPNTKKNTNTNTNTKKNTNTKTEEANASTTAHDATPYKTIAELYHSTCTSYARLRSLSEKRKRAIAARWTEHKHDLGVFRELFTLAEASAFLKGANSRNWVADFDWLMNSSNMAKVLEGKYNAKRGGEERAEHHGHPGAQLHEGARETTLSGFTMADD